MAEERVERRLAAILAADVAGYSRLVGIDEEGTLAALRRLRRELIDPSLAEHRGRIVKTTGDGLLAEFASVVDALRCAAAVQRAMAERNAALPADRRLEFRIGIHQGDIVVEDGDIFGDGVNVAARLEALAEPGGICVSARVQEDATGRLDLVFADLGEQALKNIARPVRVYRVRTTLTHPVAGAPGSPLSRNAGEGAERSEAGEGGSAALALPDKPSIAVLPFQNMSGDPEQEYFVDGMVEEIITALSRIRWLFVIARNSTFTYKGQAVDVKRVGRELGVRYVLEGSVRKGGGRVRITAQLVEAETGAHLWAERFDGSLEKVFELQDQVATAVAGVIEPALLGAEVARTAGRPTTDFSAYDAYLRAYATLFSPGKEIPDALHLLEQVIARDPNFGPALAAAAMCCSRMIVDGSSENAAADRRKGTDFARRALTVAGDDAVTLANAAFALAGFGGDLHSMIAIVERALSLNPSFARGWYISGYLMLLAGDLDRTIECAETAERLSPRVRGGVGSPSQVIGAALVLSRRFEEAIPRLEGNSSPLPLRWLAACYAHLGRFDEAREVAARLRALGAAVVPDYPLPYRRPEHRELLLSGLRLAAGEE
jgi:adenylate cyclase